MFGFGMALTAPEILRAPTPPPAGGMIYITYADIFNDGNLNRSRVLNCSFPAGTTAVLTVRWVRTSDDVSLGTRVSVDGNPVSPTGLAISPGVEFEIQYTIDTSTVGWTDATSWQSLGIYSIVDGEEEWFPYMPS